MIARIFMALVLLFSIALWAGYYYLGSAAKAGIEFAGEAAFKTEVRVESVTLSPLNGKSSIRGLSIANPAGYSEGPAIALGAIEATVNLGSLFDDDDRDRAAETCPAANQLRNKDHSRQSPRAACESAKSRCRISVRGRACCGFG